MSRISFVVASLGLALVACRGSSGDDQPTIDSPVTGGQHIQDVQNDAMAPGTAVALKGVVVTAIDAFGAKTGDIWVEEPGGGEFSGVHVFGAPLDQVSALAPGDLVDIAGAEKDEFALATDLSGKTITELKPVSGGMMTVSKSGTGMIPAPHMVDALAIGQMSQTARDAEWEKWEGVLITVPHISAFNKPACVGTACTDMTLEKFDVTGGLVVESSLAAFPTGVDRAVCLASATGVVDYFFDYLLLPRTTAEVATGGTGCPVAEGASHAVCSDAIDNDGNGFSDCMDNGCVVGDSACRATTTISAIQSAIPMGAVEVDNVFVTGVSFNKKTIWVSTSLAAAANEGITVFSSTAVGNTVVVGAKVNVIGTAVENNNDMMGSTLTEINALAVNVIAAPTTQPVPVVGQTVASLTQVSTGEPYESVLVTLSNVKVVTLGVANFFVSDMQQKTTAVTAFKADDDMYRFVAADGGKCYSVITGIWSYSVFENAYIFLPRSLAGSNPATPDGTLAADQTACN